MDNKISPVWEGLGKAIPLACFALAASMIDLKKRGDELYLDYETAYKNMLAFWRFIDPIKEQSHD